MRAITIWGVLLSITISVQALAFGPYSLSNILQTKYFYGYEAQRHGVEIEYKGLGIEKSAQIIRSQVGGQIVYGKSEEGLDYAIIRNSIIGTFKVKVETNQKGDTITPESEWVYEIVGPPLYYQGNQLLQTVVSALLKAGAIGAESDAPLSIQPNREVAPNADKLSQKEMAEILKFEFKVMRNVFNNLDIFMREWDPVPSRLDYIARPSDGLMKLMRDPNYKPDAIRILQDVVYRQSLEFLGRADAFNIPFSEVMASLEKLNFPIVERVVKLTPHRISSLICTVFPEDLYCRKYIETKWTFRAPIVEHRPYNNNHDIMSPLRESVGIANATREHGLFLFNSETAELRPLTGLNSFVCEQIFAAAAGF